VLASIIDDEISKIRKPKSGPALSLDAAGKIRLLFKTKEMVDAQKMMEHVTGALTLLITACNS
jgi:hypothetical protein